MRISTLSFIGRNVYTLCQHGFSDVVKGQYRLVLKMVFARLHYPETLVENTNKHFAEMKVTTNAYSKQQVSDEQDAPIGIVLPFKDQKSAKSQS